MKNKTIREAYHMASSFLDQSGYSDTRFEAELFLRYILELDRAQFFSRLDEEISVAACDELQDLLERRVSGEPVQYVLGGTEFYGRFFFVNPSVLIPRPETEILVERLLMEAKPFWGKPAHIVEVGTGSGVIASTLLLEQSQWRVTAIDISDKALEVAKQNAALHGVGEKVNWIHGGYLTSLSDDTPVDILVSNPPYIPSHIVTSLDIEVKDFEPRIALDGGEDGLDPYRQMMEQLQMRTQVPSLVCFEIGAEQGIDVPRIIKTSFPEAIVSTHKDLAGRNRVVVAKM